MTIDDFIGRFGFGTKPEVTSSGAKFPFRPLTDEELEVCETLKRALLAATNDQKVQQHAIEFLLVLYLEGFAVDEIDKVAGIMSRNIKEQIKLLIHTKKQRSAVEQRP